MARLPRSWHPVMRSYLDSGKLNRVSMQAEALYLRILVSADVRGVYHGDAFDVASRLMTRRMKTGRATLEQVRGCMEELGSVGLIGYFRHGEENFLFIQGYQTVNESRKPEFPAPPGHPESNRGRAVPETGTTCPPIGAPQEQEQEQEQNQDHQQSSARTREPARSPGQEIDPLPDHPSGPVEAARAAKALAAWMGVGPFDESALAQALLPAASIARLLDPDASDDSRAGSLQRAAEGFLEGLEREPVSRRMKFALARIKKQMVPALELQANREGLR